MYSATLEQVKRDSGEKSYPIWLLLNPKHPAVRQNIWVPVLAEIQDKIYREIHARIDTSDIYIRNAVLDAGIVPKTLNWWEAEVASEIEMFREEVLKYQPKILISFGAFPFEFARRTCGIKPEKGPKAWSNSNLQQEFTKAIENFDIGKTNTIPLIRRVFAGGRTAEEPTKGELRDGKGYFLHAGARIADKIIENRNSLKIWIE
ncbi:Hypothetical protein DEACI_0572 [Acididesulfobacillus acetoxydans]|uniref:Uncharacterized protein n=1 Tax=Acididesulfobacillus acetoxydans TaxID=1561005 RepID=A0A8S0VVP9_9FIRM|nr:hypothetical protein [Acididesulfobacillus acetoxydans]CAA7599933.1 Hypothetical protein DEACI_0572 [Acididesulfobacillus acetoxydans]CEJ07975.1 Hypothetical protein DEACI_2450 [Acididesulfobacillus acetoxydans]